jgi:tetratricopeptide (TPR) repeat protein
MTPRHIATVIALACLATATNASADGGCTVNPKAYPNAVAAEKAGRLKEALGLYLDAGERSGCGGQSTSNIKSAAERAAAIALPLAKAAEQKGDLEEAFKLYEQGAYFANADRVLMTIVRAKSDDMNVVGRGFKVFGERELSAAQMPISVAAAGGYVPNPTLVAELEGMVATGVERALAREAAAFNEQYLTDLVQLVQSRPEPKADMQSMMQAAVQTVTTGNADTAFHQKWPEDLMKKGQKEIGVAFAWTGVGLVQGGRTPLVTRGVERAQQRAATLVKLYSGAPELLKAAVAYSDAGYPASLGGNPPEWDRFKSEQRRAIDQIKAQAVKLGDEADARSRFTLAIAYYDVAEASDKKVATSKKQQQVFMKQAQSDVDALNKVKANLSDPATIAAMKTQAEAARAAVAAAQKQKPSDKDSAKSASDLEKELGLK